ncbi:MAG: diguanylate cyclase [Candidatus Delongbacteria bacterium]|nr:diguanylate cyclase [Candidatus Delongbacteria bacterium]
MKRKTKSNSSQSGKQLTPVREQARLSGFLLKLLLDKLGAETGSILLLEQEGQFLTFAAGCGLAPELLKKTTPLPGPGAAARVAMTAEPIHLLAGSLPPDLELPRSELQDAWIIPLKSNSILLGVLCAGSVSTPLLSPDSESFQQLLADTSSLLEEQVTTQQSTAAGLSQQEALTILRIFNSTRDFNKLVELTISLGLKLMQTGLGMLTVFQDFNRGYDTFAAHGLEDELLERLVRNLKQSIDHPFFHRERTTLVENIAELPEEHPYRFLAQIPSFDSVIVIPLLYGCRIIGRLHVFNPAAQALVVDNMRKIMYMATEAAIALAQALEIRNTSRQANYDDLTGLLSRTTWMQRLELEISRSRRLRNSLAVIMLDIDFFKVYNDTYGHQTGDQVLQILPALLRESLRDVDSAGRYGGDEFVLLLPETDLNGAILVANRILQAVRQLNLGETHSPLSISQGITVQQPGELLPRDIVRQADQALLQAKRRGRSQIIASIHNGEYIDCTGMKVEDSSDPQAAEEPLVTELTPDPGEPGYRIFMIDNESNQRHVLTDVFKNWGYETQAFPNGEDALQALQKSTCDLVITNLHLPGIRGLDVVRRIKDVDMTIPVIVLTNYGSIQTAVEAIRLGADDYIVHPFSLDEVRRSVENAFNRRQQYFTSEMADHYIGIKQKTTVLDTLHRTEADLTWEAQQLHILEEFNRHSIQQVASALLMLDENGRVLHLNQRARELLNAPANLLNHSSLFEIYPNLRDTPLEQGFQICQRTATGFQLNDLWLDPGLNAPRTLVSLQITPMLGKHAATRYLMQIDDVFDRQLLDESRERALRKLGSNLEQRLLPVLEEIKSVLQSASTPEQLSDQINQRLQEMRAVLRTSHLNPGPEPPTAIAGDQREL